MDLSMLRNVEDAQIVRLQLLYCVYCTLEYFLMYHRVIKNKCSYNLLWHIDAAKQYYEALSSMALCDIGNLNCRDVHNSHNDYSYS